MGARVLLNHNGAVVAQAGEGGYYPCSYQADSSDDAGNPIKIPINEQTDIANFISKGKKPKTGVRFFGVKYMPVGQSPSKEDDGVLYRFIGRGKGQHIIFSSTPRFTFVGLCNPATVSKMNDQVEAQTAHIWNS